MCENLRKIPENMCKQGALDVLWFEKNGAQIDIEDDFWRSLFF